MKRKVKLLMILNLIYYLNNFLYTYVKIKYNVINIFDLWAFLPYFLVLLTTFFIESSLSLKRDNIKVMSIIDLCIRILALFVNYYATFFKFKDNNFKASFSLEIIMVLINIFLELKIYKKTTSIEFDGEYRKFKNESIAIDSKVYKELKNEDKKSLMVNMGICKITCFAQFFLTGAIMRRFGINYRITFMMVLIILFIFYLQISYYTYNSFCTDKKALIKFYTRDNFTFFISLLILFYTEEFLYINTSSYNFILWLVAALFLAPTLYTYKKISDRYSKLKN
jgi:hypothetical protein